MPSDIDIARSLDVCPGCGEPKSVGTIVCWVCFKYRHEIVPLKDYLENGGVDLLSWMDMIDNPNSRVEKIRKVIEDSLLEVVDDEI